MNQIPIGSFKLHDVLEKMRIHPVANNGEGKYFECISGDKLYYRGWLAENHKKIIVGIHGFAAHSEYYVQVADQLIENGITVIGLDLKHHGHSSGSKGTVEHYEELFEQVHEFVLMLSKEYKDIPIYLMGLSMGGMLIINYSVMYPEEIIGIIAMAPAVKAKLKLSAKDILKLPYLGIMHLVKKNKPIIDITEQGKRTSRNPLRLEYDEEDNLRIKKVSSHYLLQMNKQVKKAFKNAENITHPILIMIGTQDLLVPQEGVRDFFNAITFHDKKLVEVQDSYHSLYSDIAMVEDKGWDKMREWLKNH